MPASTNLVDLTARMDMLEALLRTVPVSILQVSTGLQLFRSNDHFQTITGYSESELRSLSMLDLLPPADRSTAEADFNRYFEQTGFRHRLQRLLRKDGSELWVRMSGHVLNPPDVSPPKSMLLALEDATDLVASQERMALSQKVDESIGCAADEASALKGILKALCESLNAPVAGFWSPNEQGALTLVHDHATDEKKYAGFLNTSRALGLASGQGLPGRVLQSTAPEWIEVLSTDMSFLRREHATAAGLRSGIAFPICLEGLILGVIEVYSSRRRQFSPALIEDLVKLSLRAGLVLQRLRKAKEIANLEGELKQLHEVVNSIALVIATDSLGGINYANDLFCKTFGYSREELLDMNIRDLQGRSMAPETVENLWATVARGEVWTGETCNKTKDGRTVWFLTTWKGMRGPSGQIERYVAMRVDISDRKLTEEKLVHSAKLAALGEIAANIAHEINSPIVAMHARVKLTRSALECETLDRATLVDSSIA